MDSALVILSGGQDSVTCLAMATKIFSHVSAITFNYGQKHLTELQSAIEVCQILGITEHEIVELPQNILSSTSPLVCHSTPVPTYKSDSDVPTGIANTFIPVRNSLFLNIAFNRAVAIGANTLVTGVNQTDYSGYPDCRLEFIMATEIALNLAVFGSKSEKRIKIQTPLMHISKAETVALLYNNFSKEIADKLMLASHTCYNGIKGGCGECPACLLRDKGFRDAGIDDPLWGIRKSAVLC